LQNESILFYLTNFDRYSAKTTLVASFVSANEGSCFNANLAHMMIIFTDFHRIILLSIKIVEANGTHEEFIIRHKASNGCLKQVTHSSFNKFTINILINLSRLKDQSYTDINKFGVNW